MLNTRESSVHHLHQHCRPFGRSSLAPGELLPHRGSQKGNTHGALRSPTVSRWPPVNPDRPVASRALLGPSRCSLVPPPPTPTNALALPSSPPPTCFLPRCRPQAPGPGVRSETNSDTSYTLSSPPAARTLIQPRWLTSSTRSTPTPLVPPMANRGLGPYNASVTPWRPVAFRRPGAGPSVPGVTP